MMSQSSEKRSKWRTSTRSLLRYHKFSRLPADFLLYPVNNDSVRKKASIFLNSSCYYRDVWLKLLCAKFTLNWTNIKVISSKSNSNGSPSVTYLTTKKASLYRVKFPDSLTCLTLIGVNKKQQSHLWKCFDVIFLSLHILFISIALIFNC